MKLLATFTEPEPAYVAKGLLEAAGIKVFLDDARYPQEGEITLRVHEGMLRQSADILQRRPDLGAQLGPEVKNAGEGKKSGRSLGALFVMGGTLFLFTYFLFFLLMFTFGGRLPFRPMVIVFIFLVGGLATLVVMGGRQSSAAQEEEDAE